MKRNQVFYSIHTERMYQERKYGQLDKHPHEVGGYLTLMQVHLTKAMQNWAGNSNDVSALHEIRKVIGLGVACGEQHGLPNRTQGALNNARGTVTTDLYDVGVYRDGKYQILGQFRSSGDNLSLMRKAKSVLYNSIQPGEIIFVLPSNEMSEKVGELKEEPVTDSKIQHKWMGIISGKYEVDVIASDVKSALQELRHFIKSSGKQLLIGSVIEVHSKSQGINLKGSATFYGPEDEPVTGPQEYRWFVIVSGDIETIVFAPNKEVALEKAATFFQAKKDSFPPGTQYKVVCNNFPGVGFVKVTVEIVEERPLQEAQWAIMTGQKCVGVVFALNEGIAYKRASFELAQRSGEFPPGSVFTVLCVNIPKDSNPVTIE